HAVLDGLDCQLAVVVAAGLLVERAHAAFPLIAWHRCFSADKASIAASISGAIWRHSRSVICAPPSLYGDVTTARLCTAPVVVIMASVSHFAVIGTDRRL